MFRRFLPPSAKKARPIGSCKDISYGFFNDPGWDLEASAPKPKPAHKPKARPRKYSEDDISIGFFNDPSWDKPASKKAVAAAKPGQPKPAQPKRPS